MVSNRKNHVYIDTNVLIDFVEYQHFLAHLADPDPAINANKALGFLFQQRSLRLYISSVSVLQLISYFQKKRRKLALQPMSAAVRQLMQKCMVVELSESDIRTGLRLESADLEDNIQYVLSQKVKCLYIVTNNHKDFREFANIDVVKPAQVRRVMV